MARPRFLGLMLALITVLVYLPAYRHRFLVYDDNDYVTENRVVQSGLTVDGVKWAFASWHANNWHPVTWLSHMLDCQLFGLDPAPQHFVNALIHAANTVLLFLLLLKLTEKTWPSAFVAALFAWHPLHVESVAWIAERKDVLSAFFGLLTLLAYVSYARTKSKRDYVLALLCFALGLMAKPMLVTLPCVMLLLDVWPLKRVSGARFQVSGVVEKLPFFALTLASCVVTFLAQRAEAVATLERHPLGLRVANAVVSYARYLGKTFWPVKLAIPYPLPESLPAGEVAGAAALLVAVTAGAWLARRRNPALLVGWLWFLGMLVPVIGLVQVGGQAMADRYTYLPLIGVFLAIAFGLSGVAARFKPVLSTFAALALAACIGVTEWQLRFWRDSETLFRHALAVTTNNAVAHINLGVALDQQGRKEEELAEYRAALGIDPGHAQAHNNLANLLSETGARDEALGEYREALRLKPNAPLVHANLGTLLSELGRLDDAMPEFNEAARLAPGSPRPYYLMGKACLRHGRSADAAAHFREALARDPDDMQALLWLARVLAAAENPAVRNGGEAITLTERANDATGGEQPFVLDTAAMARAEAGQFRSAEELERRAIELARAAGAEKETAGMEERLRLYQSGIPYREAFTNAPASSDRGAGP